MNLLYVLTAYPPSTGGAQLHQHLLAQQMLKRHGVQVVTIWDRNRTDWLIGTTLRAPSHPRDYRLDGIPVRRIALSAADKLRVAPFVAAYYPLMDTAMPHIAARYAPYILAYAESADLIHSVRIGREALSYAALGAARERGIPFLLTPVHHPRWGARRYRLYHRLYREADGILALTSAEKRTLVELGVAEERVTVTGIGPVLADSADPDRFLSRQRIDGPVVLFAGQHYRYKGYRALLEAMPLVWQSVPDAHFVFIGPSVGSSESDFDRFVDRRVHRLGSVSLQDKTDAFAACDLFCMPSTQESFGGVYTEAWTFAKPVIGCPIPAVAEVIDDGVDGCLTAQEPQPIAEAIASLLLNPTLRQRMGAAGHAKVQRRFRWEVIADLTERAYAAASA